MKRLSFVVLMSVLLLAACSGGNDQQKQNSQLFKDQTRALDKAKQVNKIIQDQAEKERQMIDKQTGQ
ncbi:MAG: hypothetical protein P8Y64_07370 [Gammaproteobacteria bacterium]|jgi:uncharacterized lipoprotein